VKRHMAEGGGHIPDYNVLKGGGELSDEGNDVKTLEKNHTYEV